MYLSTDFSHGLNTGFFIHESYPLVNYLEYPLLIVQNFVLIYIIGEVTNSIMKSVFTIAAFITFIYVVGIGAIPKYLLVAALVNYRNVFDLDFDKL